MKNLLITGANGFVGSALCSEAILRGFIVRGAIRTVKDLQLDVKETGLEKIVVGDINANTDWSHALLNCDVVIHLAARVHIMCDGADDPLAEFRLVNTVGSEHLARCAAASGVKRLVYISSIKVSRRYFLMGNNYKAKMYNLALKTIIVQIAFHELY